MRSFSGCSGIAASATPLPSSVISLKRNGGLAPLHILVACVGLLALVQSSTGALFSASNPLSLIASGVGGENALPHEHLRHQRSVKAARHLLPCTPSVY